MTSPGILVRSLSGLVVGCATLLVGILLLSVLPVAPIVAVPLGAVLILAGAWLSYQTRYDALLEREENAMASPPWTVSAREEVPTKPREWTSSFLTMPTTRLHRSPFALLWRLVVALMVVGVGVLTLKDALAPMLVRLVSMLQRGP